MIDTPQDFNDAIVALPLQNSAEICLVNFSDLCFAINFKWSVDSRGRVYRSKKGSRTERLAQTIMNEDNIDHIDRNHMNNIRTNLRSSTLCQNQANRGKPTTRQFTSKYKGVNWHKNNKRWEAGIKVNGIRKFIGSFTDEVEAAKAYNKAAIKHFGEFACLNKISSSEE